LTLVAISIYRFADGKIVENWGVDVQWQRGAVWE
jgi:predicted SnoaL-like aldol condensation-catalyzing enzyme